MSPSMVITSSRSSITVHPRRFPSSVAHGHGVPVSQLALAWSPVYLFPYGELYVFQDPPYGPCTHHCPRVRGSSQGQPHPSFGPESTLVVSNACPQCWSYPMHPRHRFCSIACSQYAARFASQLKYLPRYHELYIKVANQFIQRWTSESSPCPNVLAVLMINCPDASQRSFQRYRDAVEARGRFTLMGFSPGNEQKRFRSTNRACTLGERGNVTPCHNEACWMCETIRLGFEPHLQRKRSIPWNGCGIRLGAGIYTGYASSKAHNYANNLIDPASNVRAMLVCRVVIGMPYKMYEEDTTLRQPPPGYDCVLGKSAPRSAFTEDEYVVYDADAIRPAYLVLYETPLGN